MQGRIRNLHRVVVAVVAVAVVTALVLAQATDGPRLVEIHAGTPEPSPTQVDPGITLSAAEAPSVASVIVADEAAAYQRDIDAWNAGVQQAEADAREAARVAAAQARTQPAPSPVPAAAPPTASGSSLAPCGGAYPPCYIVQRESGGSYSAFNAGGCTATINGVTRSGCYGKWQFGWFWGGRLGLPENLADATPAQQDEAARLLWNNGAGCSNWSAC